MRIPFFRQLGEMLRHLSSAAVVIGTLRVKTNKIQGPKCHMHVQK